MTKDPTSLTWYRKPFGRRVITAGRPEFSISPPSDGEDGDARRRHDLAFLAGL